MTKTTYENINKTREQLKERVVEKAIANKINEEANAIKEAQRLNRVEKWLR